MGMCAGSDLQVGRSLWASGGRGGILGASGGRGALASCSYLGYLPLWGAHVCCQPEVQSPGPSTLPKPSPPPRPAPPAPDKVH